MAAARSVFRSSFSVRNATARLASGTKPSPSPFRFPTSKPLSNRLFRCPVELSACVETMQPFHTATASALMTSMLSISQRSCCWLAEGNDMIRLTERKNLLDIKEEERTELSFSFPTVALPPKLSHVIRRRNCRPNFPLLPNIHLKPPSRSATIPWRSATHQSNRAPITTCFPRQIPTTRYGVAPPVQGIPPTHAAMYRPNHHHGVGPPANTVQSGPGPAHTDPLDSHPTKESIDAAIGEVLSQPWLPLPIGLKPPATDSVMGELERQGIPAVPPSCA